MKSDQDSVLQAKYLLEKMLPNLDTTHPAHFVEYMGVLAKTGSNFEEYLKVVEKYFSKVVEKYFSNTTSLELKLILEAALYGCFLKRYESEHCFNEFFKVMQKFHPQKPKKQKKNGNKKSIWFYQPNAVFLAHTNALFKLLENDHSLNIEVNVVCLKHNDNFSQACQNLGANFVVLEGSTYEEKFKNLVEMSADALAVVWNGPPIHLSYISTKLNNIVYWSHRFHPSFANVKLFINGDPSPTPISHHFGKAWHYFFSGFSLKNIGKKSKWKNRENNFGSFCREALIDVEEHWHNVSILMSHNKDLVYHYAGRNKIHEKWCEIFGIDTSRVRFLGWLTAPEAAIRSMAFVLDGTKWGHGLLGMEALASTVPILSPGKTEGFYNNFVENYNFETEERVSLDEISWSRFNNTAELISVSTLLLNEFSNVKLGELLSRKILEREKSKSDLAGLVHLIVSNINLDL